MMLIISMTSVLPMQIPTFKSAFDNDFCKCDDST